MKELLPLAVSLDKITPADAPLVGGKAFNCARLKQAGIAVPDALVLTIDAMGKEDLPELEQWLGGLGEDARLAVRSSGVDEDSAGHSFAGIHETTLNVTLADVPEAVRRCWASVTSPQALAYRRVKKLDAKNPRTAVLVQIMVNAVASGVAFTIDPVTGNNDEIVINSIFGLGEDLVSGLVEPDEYHVRKSSPQIVASHMAGSKQSLSDDLVFQLTEILLRIERHFGAAQDVEWCHDGKQFWIVQSRPITAEGIAKKRDTQWTRANVRELFPDLPPPLTVYSVADWVLNGERRYFGRLMGPEDKLGPVISIFNGRLYFNLDQLRHICSVTGRPASIVLRAVGHEGELSPADRVAQPVPLRAKLRCIPDFLRISSGMMHVKTKVAAAIEVVDRGVRRLGATDFQALSDQDLWAENRNWRPRYIDLLQVIFTLTAVSRHEAALEKICNGVGMPYARLAHTHLATGEKSVSSQQAFDLLRLVQVARREGRGVKSEEFKREFTAFIERYGHRGRYESDVSLPRYAEDPTPLLFAIQSHLQAEASPDPDEIVRRQNAEAAKAWMEFESRLNPFQRLTLVPKARRLLRRIKQFYIWRELLRSEFIRIAYPLRLAHLELARRLVQKGWIVSRDDYFYLRLEEIDAVIDGLAPGTSLAGIIEKRKAEWKRYAEIEMPMLMRESQLPALSRQSVPVSPAETTSVLRGLAVSPGFAEAEVVIMNDAAEFSRMKRGAILVAPATDPSWTPLFTLASGVIVEVGGILSHASTVAREYGLPAIANVKDATRILKNGDRVRLNATSGTIQILDCV